MNETFIRLTEFVLDGYEEHFQAKVRKYLIGVLRRPNLVAMLAYQVLLAIPPSLWSAVDEDQVKVRKSLIVGLQDTGRRRGL